MIWLAISVKMVNLHRWKKLNFIITKSIPWLMAILSAVAIGTRIKCWFEAMFWCIQTRSYFGNTLIFLQLFSEINSVLVAFCRCVVCSKDMDTMHTFQRHMKYHQKKPLDCSHCDKVFLSKIGLDLHLLKKHNIGKWPADYCGNPVFLL